jgi:Na+:H+ antiporter, NhaA family
MSSPPVLEGDGAPHHEDRPGPPLRHSWSQSNRFVPRAFVRPVQAYMAAGAAGGVFMLVAALVAMVWANSPAADSYEALWNTPLVIEVGSVLHLDHLSLRDWVNEGLMAIFFLAVGLEIKRELAIGELRDPRAAALPAVAALGGMVVPALIYVSFNAGTPAVRGWGIPMATDIAFALGIVALFSRRVPLGAKLFLLALVIVDDLGAVIVIAVFYTQDLAVGWLAVAVAAVLGAIAARKLEIVNLVPYLVLAAVCWFGLLESGVHATLSGVAFGLITPAWAFQDPRRFGSSARPMVADIEHLWQGDPSLHDHDRAEAAFRELDRLVTESRSPLDRFQNRLTPWVSFAIVPVFALANAGVRISVGDLTGALGNPVLLGVGTGLVAGKLLGIVSATWLAVRLGVARLPKGTTWRHVVALGATAGIGFTVALFVSELSFTDPDLVNSAKLGILGASLVAGVTGFLLLRSCPETDAGDPALAGGTTEPAPAAAGTA